MTVGVRVGVEVTEGTVVGVQVAVRVGVTVGVRVGVEVAEGTAVGVQVAV